MAGLRIKPDAHTSRLPGIAAAATAGMGGVAMFGWAIGSAPLKSTLPGAVSMQPWTAAGLVLAAGALWLATSKRRAARSSATCLAAAVGLIAVIPALEYATGYTLGTDTWLFPTAVRFHQTTRYSYPGRPSDVASWALLAWSGAMILSRWEQRHIARVGVSALATLALTIGATGLLHYALPFELFKATLQRHPLAPNTAFAIAALGAGTLALRVGSGRLRIAGDRMSLGRLGDALLAAALLALVLAASVTGELMAAANGASDAYLRLETLRSTLTDAETGQRGYLLTQRGEYLAPYDAAVARVPDDLDLVDAALANHETLEPLLSTLRGVVHEKLLELSLTMKLAKSGDYAGALALVRTDIGEYEMDHIRQTIALLETEAQAGLRHARGISLLFGLSAAAVLALALSGRFASSRLQRRTAKALAQTQTRERDLIATLALGSFMTRDSDGTIRFWADGCERLYGWSAHEAIGRRSHELLKTMFPVSQREVEETLARTGAWAGDLRQCARDGREIVVTAYQVLRHNDDGLPVVLEALADVTAERQAEAALREQEILLRAVVETSPGPIFAKDRNGRLTLANAATLALIGQSWDCVKGLTDREFLDDTAQGERIMRTDREIMAGGRTQALEELVTDPTGHLRTYLSSKSPMRNVDGEVVGIVGVSMDISERKRFEDRLQLMVNELNHRVKNTLTTVQSIAMQTLLPADESLLEALVDRLHALAATHDVLTREGWTDAELADLIDGALKPHRGVNAHGLRTSGPQLRLRPQAAVAISMALNELATNALKYGALSTEAGELSIHWKIVDGTEPVFRLVWRERLGPPVLQPTHRGFGSSLIERSLAHDLAGKADIIFHPGGVECVVEAPLREILKVDGAVPYPRVGVMERSGDIGSRDSMLVG